MIPKIAYCPVCQRLHKYTIAYIDFGQVKKHEDGNNYPVLNCGRHTYNEYRKACGLAVSFRKSGGTKPPVENEFLKVYCFRVDVENEEGTAPGELVFKDIYVEAQDYGESEQKAVNKATKKYLGDWFNLREIEA